MLWDCQIVADSKLLLPCDFNSNLLAITVSCRNQRPTWYRAGSLQSYIQIENQSFVGLKRDLHFGSQLIEIPYKHYTLSFDPIEWAFGVSVKIKQLLISEYYSPMSGSYQQPPLTVTADAPLTIPAAVANAVIVPANPLRSPECLIVNNSNKNMWVTFTGSAATTAAPSIKVIPGGNYDVPGSYTGAINAIWEAAATGSAVFYGFTAQ
jgi:hypothetical protein